MSPLAIPMGAGFPSWCDKWSRTKSLLDNWWETREVLSLLLPLAWPVLSSLPVSPWAPRASVLCVCVGGLPGILFTPKLANKGPGLRLRWSPPLGPHDIKDMVGGSLEEAK